MRDIEYIEGRDYCHDLSIDGNTSYLLSDEQALELYHKLGKHLMQHNVLKPELNGRDVIGSERELSATADMETPAKRLLFGVYHKEGQEWFQELDTVRFSFPEEAISASIRAMEEHEAKYSKDNSILGPRGRALIEFGFISGVIDAIRNKKEGLV